MPLRSGGFLVDSKMKMICAGHICGQDSLDRQVRVSYTFAPHKEVAIAGLVAVEIADEARRSLEDRDISMIIIGKDLK